MVSIEASIMNTLYSNCVKKELVTFKIYEI